MNHKSKKKTANADPGNLIKAKKRKREPSPTALGDIEGALHIGQKRYVMVKHDADAPYLDIRQYYENKSKDLVSTTRGVTLNKSQWEKICEDMPNIGRRIVSIFFTNFWAKLASRSEHQTSVVVPNQMSL